MTMKYYVNPAGNRQQKMYKIYRPSVIL